MNHNENTPTDDEREARLEYVIDAAVPVDEFPSWRFRYSRRIADAVRAAGLVVEPQGEPSDAEVNRGAQALFDEILSGSSIGDVAGTFARCQNYTRLVLRAR